MAKKLTPKNRHRRPPEQRDKPLFPGDIADLRHINVHAEVARNRRDAAERNWEAEHERYVVGSLPAYGYGTTQGALPGWASPVLTLPTAAHDGTDSVRNLPSGRIRRSYDIVPSFCQVSYCGAQLQPSGTCPNGCTV